MREARKVSITTLKNYTYYDKLEGRLRWRVDVGKMKAGSIAGTKKPVCRMRIDGEIIPVARAIWAYHHNEWPKEPETIVHRNGDKTDCSIGNLEKKTRRQVTQKLIRDRFGKVGCCKTQYGWKSAVLENGKRKWFPTRKTKIAAMADYWTYVRGLKDNIKQGATHNEPNKKTDDSFWNG